jgi:protein ImuB
MIVCMVTDGGSESRNLLEAALLEAAPRVKLEAGRAWLDVRGLAPASVHERLRQRLASAGLTVRAGAALRPVVAEVAAAQAGAGELVEVAAGGEAEFLSPLPLSVLGLTDPLLGWLADVGIERCGELAAVPREAVEVRFGGGAVEWWRRSGGDDERRLFVRVPPEQPQASVDFVDYVVTDPERLIFTTNALLGGLCEQMREGGSHARRLRLRLPLANGTVWERTLRTARPTADRAAWLRLARALLERLTVPDSVAGVALEVESTEAAGTVQGDLFDAGFATASAVEAAVARVLEDQGPVVRQPVANAHPLAERRGEYRPLGVREALASQPAGTGATGPPGHEPPGPVPPGRTLSASAAGNGTPASADPDEPLGLTLQLLDEPRPVKVETVRRRDHQVPVRYHDNRWHVVVNAAGPDRVSGGQWDTTYAREYFRAVTGDGALVWLFRDAGRDRWYLHGWWD